MNRLRCSLPDMVCHGLRGCMAGLMDLCDEVGGNIVGSRGMCARRDLEIRHHRPGSAQYDMASV